MHLTCQDEACCRHVQLSEEEGQLLEHLLEQPDAPAAILTALRRVEEATAAAASATGEPQHLLLSAAEAAGRNISLLPGRLACVMLAC